MGRFNAFLPDRTGMRLPGAIELQDINSIPLYSLSSCVPALIEDQA